MRICGPTKGVTKNSCELVECIGTQKDRSKTCNNDTRELIDKGRRVCGKLANSPASSDVFKNNQKVWMETQISLGCLPRKRAKTDHRYFQAQLIGNVNYPWMPEAQEMPPEGMPRSVVHSNLPEAGFGVSEIYERPRGTEGG
jgi:hypothetical protein